jgi:hypothetical protein
MPAVIKPREQEMLSRAHVARVGPLGNPVVGGDGMPVLPKGRPIDLRRNVGDDAVYQDFVGVGRCHASDG